jgi:hypothetical protein
MADAEQNSWWSMPAMRARLPEGTTLGYWAGPDAGRPDAAFVAVSPDRKRVLSAVALEGGSRVIRCEGDKVSGAPDGARRVSSLDIEGVSDGGWVVMFHTEPVLARSVLSFDTGAGDGSMRFVLTGLAAGNWEIWRNGWSVDSVEVRPREGVLFFEGRPGSYFLRPLI